jgi:deoxyribose-phosphate aldolase
MNLANFIEHTLLRPDTDLTHIQKLCQEAVAHQFYGVCVSPFFVRDAARILEGKRQKVITVVGFPMGYSATPAKVEEVKRAIDEGCHEIDVVANINAVKSGNWAYVKNDIESMTRAAHLRGRVIKVILETALINEEEIKRLCDICNKIEANFVKTATGFNGTNNSPELVATLKKYISSDTKIKVSGGIDTKEKAQILINAGANRIGTSKGLQLI